MLFIAQYEIAYKQDPDNYILCLCIAVVYCNLSLQKHSLHRNTLVLQVSKLSVNGNIITVDPLYCGSLKGPS